MKSLKKTLVLLVVFSMILSTLVPAFAFTDADKLVEADCEEAVSRMVALEIINGYAEDNTFRPEGSIKRSEMAKIICKMVGIDEGTVAESANVASKFNDIPAGAWYAGYVNVAAGRGIINGFPDGSFRPEETLTMNQVLTLVVNALGRGEHVSTMGTWPANYIAEAAKLGLIDDVKTTENNGVKVTEPNRGNVAIICWNTLKAPYVWDVENTEYQGNINLGNSSRSLLSIYFRDFVYTNDKDVEFFKEAEYLTVKTAPSMDKDLGSRQIVLNTANNADFAKIKDDFELAAPRKNEEEATWLEGSDLIAYVPEAVCEDLESLYGKEVTVIFGEDNVVAAIIVTNDSFVDNEFIEKIDVANDKITIAGETYKYTANTEVYVNGVAFGKGEDQITAILTAAGVENISSTRSLTKLIKANVIMNNKNKMERIDMTVSGEYSIQSADPTYALVNNTTFATEKANVATLLTDVETAVNGLASDSTAIDTIKTNVDSLVTAITSFNNSVATDIDTTALSALTTTSTKADAVAAIAPAKTAVDAAVADITATHKISQRIVEEIKKNGNVMAVGYAEKLYNFEDLIEEETEPKVVKDGSEITLDEIVEGDVLTIVYNVVNTKDEIRTIYVSSDKVEGEIENINRDLSFKVDGERYFANYNALFTTTGELDEVENDDVVDYIALKDIDGEIATVYLNVLGEYAAVVTESTSTDGVFAVVKKVYELDEDDEDEEFIKISVMLADGTSAKYLIKYSEKADRTTGALTKTLAEIDGSNAILLNKLIRAKVNSDNIIMIDDLEIAQAGTVGKIDGTDVKVVTLPTSSTIEYDDKIIKNGNVEYDFAKADFLNYDDTQGAEEWETSKWKSLVKDPATADTTIGTNAYLNANTLYVVEDSTAKILDVKLVVNTTSQFASTGVEYGIVVNVENKTTDKENITLYTKNGEMTYEVATADVELDAGRIECGDFVLFEASNGKIVSTKLTRIIDVVDLNSIEDLALANAINFTAKYDGVNLAVATEKVNNTTKDHLVVKYDADYTNRLFYEKSGDIELAYVRLNKDGVTIFDLSEMDQYGAGVTTLTDISELDGRKVIAIESDSETGAEILVVIGD